MTPEEIAECRAARDRFLAGNSSQVILAEILSTMLEHIDSQADEIKQANHRYADLQNVCDDQAEEIKRLEDALVEERARRICHQPREDKVGHWPRYENVVVDEARAQLRAEGAIRESALSTIEKLIEELLEHDT